MVEINIVRKPGNRIGPSGAARAALATGDLVVLNVDEDGATGHITFDDGRSPFGETHTSVKYGQSVPIIAKVHAEPGRNVYKYTCVMTDKHGKTVASVGGGEIEIIRRH